MASVLPTQTANYEIGICQIRVKDLEFIKQLTRRARKRKDRALAEKKMENMLRLPSRKPHDLGCYLSVLVYADELNNIVAHSNSSITEIVHGQRGQYPKLFPPHKLVCLHGRRRWKATINIDPNTWWTVHLKCIPRGSEPLALFREIIEDGGDEIPWSDGDIYRKVRFYKNQASIAQWWATKLSDYKQKALSRLLDQQVLCDKLDNLLVFPGLWAGFELGNVEKELALRSVYEFSNCVDEIFQVWDFITLGNPILREAVDEDTVEGLELLAPAYNADREKVRCLMRSQAIFSDVTDPYQRQRLESRILEVKILIPGIKSLSERLRYLGIGVKIIKQHVLNGLKRGQSIFAAMQDLWQKPTYCTIEYAEGIYLELPCPASPRLAYEHVLVIAIRNFPRLSDIRPKRENGEKPFKAGVDTAWLYCFLRGVQRLGFNSPKIMATVSKICAAGQPPDITQRIYKELQETSLKRRWGFPYTQSFECGFNQLFLCRLYLSNLSNETNTEYPTTLFIHKNIILSFFQRGTIESVLNILASSNAFLAQQNFRKLSIESGSTSTISRQSSLSGSPEASSDSSVSQPVLPGVHQITRSNSHNSDATRSFLSPSENTYGRTDSGTTLPSRSSANTILPSTSRSLLSLSTLTSVDPPKEELLGRTIPPSMTRSLLSVSALTSPITLSSALDLPKEERLSRTIPPSVTRSLLSLDTLTSPITLESHDMNGSARPNKTAAPGSYLNMISPSPPRSFISLYTTNEELLIPLMTSSMGRSQYGRESEISRSLLSLESSTDCQSMSERNVPFMDINTLRRLEGSD